MAGFLGQRGREFRGHRRPRVGVVCRVCGRQAGAELEHDRATQQQAQFAVFGAVRIGRRRPVGLRNDRVDVVDVLAGLLEHGSQQLHRVQPAPYAATGHDRLHQACAGVQRGDREPARIGQGALDQAVAGGLRQAGQAHPLAQRVEELGRGGPLAPVGAGHALLVCEQVLGKGRAAQPAAAERRVHHLQPAAVAAPHHHEVGRAVGMAHDHDRRQPARAGQEQVVGGDQHLLGRHAHLVGDVLDDIDRGAVDVGLAGFAQPAITDRHAEPLEDALQAGRAAVHRGRLDHLVRQPAPAAGAARGRGDGAHRTRSFVTEAPEAPEPAGAPGLEGAARAGPENHWPAVRSTSSAGTV